jgi:hypothetical protein
MTFEYSNLNDQSPGWMFRLAALPAGALVATVPTTRGIQGGVNRIVAEAQDAGTVVAVPLHVVLGARPGPLPPR